MLLRTDGGGKRLVVLTGAGISAESGLPTFRGDDGLWAGHRIEDVATPQAWIRNPELVWRFYQLRRRALLRVEPNPAHIALARLESAISRMTVGDAPDSGYLEQWEEHWESFSNDRFVLITQNVDDLHSAAGSARLIPMHGQLRFLRCEHSGVIIEMMDEQHLDPDCFILSSVREGGLMRPHIVWFGEQPFGMHAIYNALYKADVLLVVGTSGHVYPAGGFVHEAAANGARTILVNLEAPQNAEAFDEIHLGPAADVLPSLVDEWLAELEQGS